MSDQPSQEVPLTEALQLLFEECDRLCQMSEDAERAAGDLAAASINAEDQGLQYLDAIRQNLAGVRCFLSALIMSEGSRVDLQEITSDLRPRDLAQRLRGEQASCADAPNGAVDLF